MGREHLVETTLGEIFELKYGKGLPKESRLDGNIHVYGSNGIVGNHDSSITDGETIILGRKGSVGEVHYSARQCWPIDTTYYIDNFHGGIPACYWYHFLKSISLGQHEKSSAIPGISRKDIYPLTISLPPLNEQKRIVEKLDAILPKVKSAKARLEKFSAILKKFRQSVLSAACSGRLTEDWREGKELPEWEERKMGELGQVKLGKMLDRAKNQGTPTKYLRNTNVRWSGFDLEDVYEMNATESDLERFSIDDGDLLICEGGEPGRCAIWDKGPNQYIFQKAIHRVRVNATVLAKWLSFNVKFNAESGKLDEYFTGTTIKHFTLKSVKSYIIPLPPLPEQQEIVRRVEKLFALADSLEVKYKTARERVEKIEQSVLAKAFRGELAEPDPNDEPAEELLKRIIEEKAKLESGKKRRAGK